MPDIYAIEQRYGPIARVEEFPDCIHSRDNIEREVRHVLSAEWKFQSKFVAAQIGEVVIPEHFKPSSVLLFAEIEPESLLILAVWIRLECPNPIEPRSLRWARNTIRLTFTLRPATSTASPTAWLRLSAEPSLSQLSLLLHPRQAKQHLNSFSRQSALFRCSASRRRSPIRLVPNGRAIS